MDSKANIEGLKFIIGRFDQYFDSINNKGALYLSVNTFILGGVIAGFASLDERHHFQGFVTIAFLIPTLLSNLTSFHFTLRAITPFTKSWGKSTGSSRLFFVDINATPEAEWKKCWTNLSDKGWQNDLQSQAKILAGGLQIKFKRLQRATLFISIQVAFIFSFAIYFFIQY